MRWPQLGSRSSVYAAVLEDWMGTPSKDVLGRAYRKAAILRPRP